MAPELRNLVKLSILPRYGTNGAKALHAPISYQRKSSTEHRTATLILSDPIFAPLIFDFFLVFWRLAREKYLPALTAKETDTTSQN